MNSGPFGKIGWKHLLAFSLTAMLLITYSVQLRAQTLISGEVVGTVTDPSGAVIPNATVTLKSNETGQTQTAKANSNGWVIHDNRHCLEFSGGKPQS